MCSLCGVGERVAVELWKCQLPLFTNSANASCLGILYPCLGAFKRLSCSRCMKSRGSNVAGSNTSSQVGKSLMDFSCEDNYRSHLRQSCEWTAQFSRLEFTMAHRLSRINGRQRSLPRPPHKSCNENRSNFFPRFPFTRLGSKRCIGCPRRPLLNDRRTVMSVPPMCVVYMLLGVHWEVASRDLDAAGLFACACFRRT